MSTKLSRQELENACAQLKNLVEKLSAEVELKDKHIKHLTSNARNWSKKYYADFGNGKETGASKHGSQPNAAESSPDTNEELIIAQAALASSEAEKNKTRQLLIKLNASNIELTNSLKALQIETKSKELSQAKLEEKTDTVPQAILVQEKEVKEEVNNNEPEITELEFSMEMQHKLAQYAA